MPLLLFPFVYRKIVMRAVVLSFVIVSLIPLAFAAYAQTRIDAINTNFRWLGPDDKIVVERYDDPKVANVSCYMSPAETGGIKGGLDWPRTRAAFRSPVAQLVRSPCLLD
jgi:catabolite regulation protein CreA